MIDFYEEAFGFRVGAAIPGAPGNSFTPNSPVLAVVASCWAWTVTTTSIHDSGCP
ncbi:hypothetical protein [Amycolatopsis sp. MJM2582]|uniref:hypothetical protein n=1 Tax=Amycolatopsis sp. MJM2582 TaxID=1427749 RepID=UPI00350F54E7